MTPRLLKVLIAEDNAADAELLVRELRRAGFEPDWHRVDREADFVSRLHVELDLILSDYEMPQFGGLRALELLNESGLQVPFIIVSGSIGEDTAVAAMKMGAADYLIKDRLTRLGSAVEHVLRREELRRERLRAERAKVHAEASYRAIFENSVEGLYQTTADGHIIIANPAVARIAGYESVEEFIARATGVEEQFYANPRDREYFRAQMQAEGVVRGFEAQMRRRDGTLVWISSSVRMSRDAEGEICYEGTLQDITGRKHSEQALRASEQRFRTSLEKLMEGCMILGRDWRYLYVNEVGARFARHDVSELEGRLLTEIFPAIEASTMFAGFRECMDDGMPRRMETEFAYGDGTSAWFQVVIQPVPEGLFILLMDITERRQAVAALLESKMFLQSTLNALTSAVVVLDEAGAIRATNETWRRFAEENGGGDYLNKSYLGVCMKSVQASGNAEAQAAHDGIRRVLAGAAEEFRLEYACHSPREKRWFLMHVSPLGGGQRGAVVAHENITGLKLAELDVRQSEERFRRLIENASDVITVVNGEGIIEFLSPSTRRVLGHEPTDLLGHSIMEFIHADDREKAGEGLRRAVDGTAVSVPVEYRIRHVDGSWRVFQSIGRAMADSPAAWLVVVNSRDITETRKLETQFLRTQRLKAIGTLSSGIAHDLNNILAPMLMIASLLKEKLPDAEDTELLTIIEQSAQRGANIIRQLLTFSRGIEGERGVVQLRHLLKEMAGLMRETFPREITLVGHISPDLWTVIADGTQIHQVLLNLCVNARDAMHAGGKLTVDACNVYLGESDVRTQPLAKPGNYVQLSISDEGEGIPRENIDRMFEPFFTTKEIGKGTGLGLSTALGIVKSHGGFITVYSEPGLGSVFKVHLPASVGVEAAAFPAGGATAKGAGETIMIVDDEPAVRRALALTLEAHNYFVLTAVDGREATTLFLQHRDRLKLVLTDIMMPKMNGMALIRVLRALAPKLRIIAASGLLDPERREELATLAVTTILAKPFGRNETLAAVQRELGNVEQPKPVLKPPGDLR